MEGRLRAGPAGAGFHPSLLTIFRRRLAQPDDPERLFAAVRQVVEATGVLKGRHRRAPDSTVLDDAVATQDTVTQLVAAIRRVIREVPGAAEPVTLSDAEPLTPAVMSAPLGFTYECRWLRYVRANLAAL